MNYSTRFVFGKDFIEDRTTEQARQTYPNRQLRHTDTTQHLFLPVGSSYCLFRVSIRYPYVRTVLYWHSNVAYIGNVNRGVADRLSRHVCPTPPGVSDESRLHADTVHLYL